MILSEWQQSSLGQGAGYFFMSMRGVGGTGEVGA